MLITEVAQKRRDNCFLWSNSQCIRYSQTAYCDYLSNTFWNFEFRLWFWLNRPFDANVMAKINELFVPVSLYF